MGIGTLFFIAAFTGYFLFYTVILKKDAAFFPILFISFSSIFVYLFGLLGLLNIGRLIFLALGTISLAALTISCLKKGRSLALKSAVKSLLAPSFLFIFMGIVWIRFITRNAGISHFDDYTHWYKICKVLYFDDSLPFTPEIKFTTYPPGAAVFVYIVTKAAGFSVPNCFTAMSAVNLAACSCLFGALPEGRSALHRALSLTGIAVIFVLLSSVTASTFALLVDASLGLVFLSALIFITENGVKDRADLASFSIMLTFLALLKFSGLLFVLMSFILYLRFGAPSGNRLKRIALGGASCLLIPILIFAFYRIRNSFIYADLATGAQAASAARFLNIAGDKSSSDILSIAAHSVFEAFFIAGHHAVTLVWISFAGLFFLLRPARDRFMLKFLLSFYGIYTLFLTLTYIFSMDAREAQVLACYARYIGTAAIPVSGYFLFLLLRKILSFPASPLSKRNLKPFLKAAFFIIAVIAAGHLLFNWDFIIGGSHFSPEEDFYNDRIFKALSSSYEERGDHNEDKYLIIWDTDLIEYAYDWSSIAEAYFRSTNIDHLFKDNLKKDDIPLEITGYDHVVVITD